MGDATTMQGVRTTVDLPPLVYQRVKDLAERRRQSVSRTIAELTQRALADLGDPTEVKISPISGLPYISIGRPLTNDEVLAFLDDDE